VLFLHFCLAYNVSALQIFHTKNCFLQIIGKRGVEVKEIEDPHKKQVTFCKRKMGIVNKACEMAIFCDANIGIIIFSNGGNPFTIGSPNINHVIKIYLDNPVYMDQIEDSENMNAKQLQFIELKIT
jgi:hypothetical protein